jgi:hypothetical protein
MQTGFSRLTPDQYRNVVKPSALMIRDSLNPRPSPAKLRFACSPEMLHRVLVLTLSLQNLPQTYLQLDTDAAVATAAHRIVPVLAMLAPPGLLLQLWPSAGEREQLRQHAAKTAAAAQKRTDAAAPAKPHITAALAASQEPDDAGGPSHAAPPASDQRQPGIGTYVYPEDRQKVRLEITHRSDVIHEQCVIFASKQHEFEVIDCIFVIIGDHGSANAVPRRDSSRATACRTVHIDVEQPTVVCVWLQVAGASGCFDLIVNTKDREGRRRLIKGIIAFKSDLLDRLQRCCNQVR